MAAARCAFNGVGISLGINRSVSILAGGAIFNLDGNNATIAGSISGTAGGNLTVPDRQHRQHPAPSSTTNTYNGNTIVNGGTLQAVAGGLPTTTTLIDPGGASGSPTFDLHAVSRQVVETLPTTAASRTARSPTARPRSSYGRPGCQYVEHLHRRHPER